MGGMPVPSLARPEGSLWKKETKLQNAATATAGDWNQGRRGWKVKS
jgi:hypothetical protein